MSLGDCEDSTKSIGERTRSYFCSSLISESHNTIIISTLSYLVNLVFSIHILHTT